MKSDPVTLSVQTNPLALVITPVFNPAIQSEYERQAPEVIVLTDEQAMTLAKGLVAAMERR